MVNATPLADLLFGNIIIIITIIIRNCVTWIQPTQGRSLRRTCTKAGVSGRTKRLSNTRESY